MDSAGNVGLVTSVTIGLDGLPLIGYYDITNGDLKVAHCANAFCDDIAPDTTHRTASRQTRPTAPPPYSPSAGPTPARV